MPNFIKGLPTTSSRWHDHLRNIAVEASLTIASGIETTIISMLASSKAVTSASIMFLPLRVDVGFPAIVAVKYEASVDQIGSIALKLSIFLSMPRFWSGSDG